MDMFLPADWSPGQPSADPDLIEAANRKGNWDVLNAVEQTLVLMP
jgi:hypothetical protein